ncbi:hypothetical protein EOT10_16470 [Streptomyces antnestii]|uniref:Secreted protein n=1 Tax=Streptomyces antnestii TaxID=2494256 RepID=A0A3S2VHC2_9ACTN|nr:hypothetical protein [Streptomyces sp. San01]RVU23677.1 hypothetical protein EOT10_16470 [Streptomyces sp. San01]
MRRSALLATLAAGLVLASTGSAAAQNAQGSRADTDQVVVFSSELLPLTVYPDPHGCTALPTVSHVLNNQTSRTVYLHADPLCLTPGIPIQPGYGMHTGQVAGSFSS